MKNAIPLKEQILEGELLSFEDSRGDAAIVRINDKKLRCFFPEYSSYGWNELDNRGKLGTLEGKKISFFLKLFYLPGDVKTTKKQSKEIVLKHDATYEITGRIKKIKTSSEYAILDFGFPAYLDVSDFGEIPIKDGAWIKITARVDAFLVNK